MKNGREEKEKERALTLTLIVLHSYAGLSKRWRLGSSQA
jgi:hypothetical protein